MAHQHHKVAFPRLRRCIEGKDQGIVSIHLLAELYATLTGIPHKPRVRPAEAKEVLDYLQEHFILVALTQKDYRLAVDRMASLGLLDGGIYDALHAQAALKAKADVLLTLNGKHFTRLGDDIEKIVREP